MSKLALFGGEPVRNTPFASSVVIDEDEKKEILEVLTNKEISRFMGSPSQDIDELLVMKSVEASKELNQYFTFLGGKKVRRFERDFAQKFGVDYAVSVNSATSGLACALGAIGVGPGDEVITTCMSFNATAMSILHMNVIPRFCDVSPVNYCLDPDKIPKLVSPRTKAILVVHLLGYPADMDKIQAIAREHGLRIVEDCAQAPGTKYKGKLVGTIGDLGVFSFQETKNMMTGEGGMIITNNSDLAVKCRLIRNHGESIPSEESPVDMLVNNLGFNFRITELTAALGIAQLKKLDENNRIRQENSLYLIENLKGLPGLEVPQVFDEMIFHILPLKYNEIVTQVPRSKVVDAIRAEGITIGTSYLRLMYENPVFLKRIAYGTQGCPFTCPFGSGNVHYNHGDCPVGEDLIQNKFIWFHHIHRPNNKEDMKTVVEAFKKVFGHLDELKSWVPLEKKLVYKW